MEGPENCLQMRALASSASASGSMEMDAQRLARLKQEEKEKQKQEREDTTGQEEIGEEAAAMAVAMAIEETIREKADQMLSIVGKAKAGMAVKVISLKPRLATALKDEYAMLFKSTAAMEKDLITMSTKRTMDVNKVKDLIVKLARQMKKKKLID